MKPFAVQKVLGLLLMLFSLTMLPPVLVSHLYQDGTAQPFLGALVLLLGLGAVIWLPVWKRHEELKLRDGFMVVVLFWTVLGLSGALPFILSDEPHLSVTDAVFESISGLTTTGATVIVGLDDLPPSILYYRQQLQWLGGMGIIVLAVAILPVLGIGGMQLVPGGDAWAHEGQQANAPHHRDRQGPLVYLPRADHCLRSGLLAGGHDPL